MTTTKEITGGIYLVLNPAITKELLLKKLQEALAGGVQVLQIWNNWPSEYTLPDKQNLINQIIHIAEEYAVPVLINEEWELLQNTLLHGVHFDTIPASYESVKNKINRPFLAGITCGNNISVVQWAQENSLDYLSFCAMFPSGSVDTCEIVNPEIVKKATEITSMPIFISGGITPYNLSTLTDLHFAGVAVISGILNALDPRAATAAYNQALKNKNI